MSEWPKGTIGEAENWEFSERPKGSIGEAEAALRAEPREVRERIARKLRALADAVAFIDPHETYALRRVATDLER